MESKYVITATNHFNRIIGPVTESRTNSGNNLSIPKHIHERIYLVYGSGECARLEEANHVFLSCKRLKRLHRGKSAGQVIRSHSRPQEPNSAPKVSIRLEKEHCRIEIASIWASAVPVCRGRSETEVFAFGVALEAAIDDVVFSVIATR